ncbi:hypothetical protein CB1_000465038 [Camelus ferus]|nr:hypothetical protein CB1_000465038 [Camelus ferus]
MVPALGGLRAESRAPQNPAPQPPSPDLHPEQDRTDVFADPWTLRLEQHGRSRRSPCAVPGTQRALSRQQLSAPRILLLPESARKDETNVLEARYVFVSSKVTPEPQRAAPTIQGTGGDREDDDGGADDDS